VKEGGGDPHEQHPPYLQQHAVPIHKRDSEGGVEGRADLHSEARADLGQRGINTPTPPTHTHKQLTAIAHPPPTHHASKRPHRKKSGATAYMGVSMVEECVRGGRGKERGQKAAGGEGAALHGTNGSHVPVRTTTECTLLGTRQR
jgi:hypothetical protein